MTETLASVLIICGSGALAEAPALLWLLRTRPKRLLIENYRGIPVVGRAGLALAAPLAAGTAIALTLREYGWLQFESPHLFAAMAATLFFGALGWLDDAYGTPDVRGMKGHLACLVNQRQVTTGLLKAVVGAIVAVWAAHLLGASAWAALPAGALIALSANAMNALDARPGRAAKVFLVASIALLCADVSSGAWNARPLIGATALAGGMLVFVVADLAERAMLGDTGANALGCALGLAVVSLTNWPTWVAVALLLLAFCLAADRWSLTRIIESVPVLRRADELGRLHRSPPPKTDAN